MDQAPLPPSGGLHSDTVTLVERAVVLLLVAILLIGVFTILRPFVTAILFGAILAIAAWPLRSGLRGLGMGRGATAATLLVLAIALLVVPALLLAPKMARQLADLWQAAAVWFDEAPQQAPDWVAQLPLVGDRVVQLWADAQNGRIDIAATLAPYSAQLRDIFVGTASALADSLLQLLLALAVATMFWVNGTALGRELLDVATRLGGPAAGRTLAVAAGAVRGVAYGIVGTAALQGLLMGVGLGIAGVGGAGTLGFVTLLLAVSQIGGPLINVIGFGAAWYLWQHDAVGWAVFVAAWTVMVVTADNVVRPWLISFGAAMPLTLVILGVFGGFLSFGFLGLFIGPSLLAVFYNLVAEWRGRTRSAAP